MLFHKTKAGRSCTEALVTGKRCIRLYSVCHSLLFVYTMAMYTYIHTDRQHAGCFLRLQKERNGFPLRGFFAIFSSKINHFFVVACTRVCGRIRVEAQFPVGAKIVPMQCPFFLCRKLSTTFDETPDPTGDNYYFPTFCTSQIQENV